MFCMHLFYCATSLMHHTLELRMMKWKKPVMSSSCWNSDYIFFLISSCASSLQSLFHVLFLCPLFLLLSPFTFFCSCFVSFSSLQVFSFACLFFFRLFVSFSYFPFLFLSRRHTFYSFFLLYSPTSLVSFLSREIGLFVKQEFWPF